MKIVEKRQNGTKRVATKFEGKTRTQQQFKDQCDVNLIIAKYRKTGTIAHVRNAQQGVYADLASLPQSYDEALRVVIDANRAFEEVPAQIRKKFKNNPQEFLEFLQDPSNDEEAIKLGLKIKNEKIQTNDNKNSLQKTTKTSSKKQDQIQDKQDPIQDKSDD